MDADNTAQFLQNSSKALWLRSESTRGCLVFPPLPITFLLNHVSFYSLACAANALLVSQVTCASFPNFSYGKFVLKVQVPL